MKTNWKLDPDDPLAKAIRRSKQKVIRLLTVVVGAIVLAMLLGVPHMQTTYRYPSHGRESVPVKDRYKIAANYLGPFGWREVGRFEFDEGLPFIKLIPLHGCIDFKQYESKFPFFLLPKEYRDGNPAS